MKKRLIALTLVFSLLLTAAGCAAAGRRLDNARVRIEETLDAAGDSLEQSVRRAVTPAPAESSVQTAAPSEMPVTTVPPAASDPITKEKAEEIALNYLNLTRDQVRRLRTDYEIDDGVGQYDVEFIAGDYEYEFEIHGETGKILSFDRDNRYD